MNDRRIAALVLTSLGVILLALGAFLPWWTLEGPEGSAELTVRAIEVCQKSDDDPGRCETFSFSDMPDGATGREKAFATAGRATFYAGLVTIAVLVLALIFAAGGQSAGAYLFAPRIGAVLAFVTLACAIAFVALKPHDLEPFKLAAGQVVGLCAGAVAATGAILLATLRPATQLAPQAVGAYAHGYAAPSASVPVPPGPRTAVPACPQCGAPTQFIAQYGKHYCASCRVYC